MLTWELVGAVVGAGLASGREIASFFSRYGAWSIAGIILAVMTMLFLADVTLPNRWKDQWQGKAWNILLSLLLIATGGAMLSGAGNIAALTLPVNGAYWLGIVGTMMLGWHLAHRTDSGLAWVSRILLGVLAVMISLGLFLPPMAAAYIDETNIPFALLRAASYGGFNAALQAPIMACAKKSPQTTRRRAVCCADAIIFLLLMLGNAVLLRHPALLAEEMPFIRLLEEFGRFGYVLGALCLYLAILSTLTACLRGLGRNMITTAGVVAVSLLGFTGVVELAYPILGGGCFVMLLAAKFTNSSRRTFLSRCDML